MNSFRSQQQVKEELLSVIRVDYFIKYRYIGTSIYTAPRCTEGAKIYGPRVACVEELL